MEYKKIINSLDNTPNQPTKFKTKNWVEINDESHGLYNAGIQIKVKNLMLRSSLCDFSDAYILKKGTISIERVLAPAETRKVGKKVVFKNCAPFKDYINEIKNIQIDDSKYIHAVMAMYNLIEYSDNYSKTSGSL